VPHASTAKRALGQVLVISELDTPMMQAGSTSEMLTNLYRTTQHNNPEDKHIFILATMRNSNLTKFLTCYNKNRREIHC
jgi:hypothetical protein